MEWASRKSGIRIGVAPAAKGESLRVDWKAVKFMLNFALLKQPLNWLTIILMLYLAAMFGTLALQYAGIEPATGS